MFFFCNNRLIVFLFMGLFFSGFLQAELLLVKLSNNDVVVYSGDQLLLKSNIYDDPEVNKYAVENNKPKFPIGNLFSGQKNKDFLDLATLENNAFLLLGYALEHADVKGFLNNINADDVVDVVLVAAGYDEFDPPRRVEVGNDLSSRAKTILQKKNNVRLAAIGKVLVVHDTVFELEVGTHINPDGWVAFNTTYTLWLNKNREESIVEMACPIPLAGSFQWGQDAKNKPNPFFIFFRQIGSNNGAGEILFKYAVLQTQKDSDEWHLKRMAITMLRKGVEEHMLPWLVEHKSKIELSKDKIMHFMGLYSEGYEMIDKGYDGNETWLKELFENRELCNGIEYYYGDSISQYYKDVCNHLLRQ